MTKDQFDDQVDDLQPCQMQEVLKRQTVSYRKLTDNDLEVFISMRIAQLREEGATEDLDLRPPLMDYCAPLLSVQRRHIAPRLRPQHRS